MTYITSTPDVTEAICNQLRNYHRSRGGRFFISHYTDQDTVGRFAGAGGAIVEVRVIAKFSKERYPSEEGLVQVGASVVCHGDGCPTSAHEEPLTEPVSVDGVSKDIAVTALPAVQAAREWAQAHAEKCRAMAVAR
jgi:hypothetical protein